MEQTARGLNEMRTGRFDVSKVRDEVSSPVVATISQGELTVNDIQLTPPSHIDVPDIRLDSSAPADYSPWNTITSNNRIGPVVLNLAARHQSSKDHANNSFTKLGDGGRLLSSVYALVICLIGIALPVAEALRDTWLDVLAFGVFLSYLYTVSAIFFVYLQFYHYQRVHKKHHENQAPLGHHTASGIILKDAKITYGVDGKGNLPEILENRDRSNTVDSVTSKTSYNNALGTSFEMGSITSSDSEEQEDVFHIVLDVEKESRLPHHTSLYIRLGTVVFGIGCMLYVGLNIKHYAQDLPSAGCFVGSVSWVFYFHLGFLLLQTFFMFKHPQLHIYNYQELARFGFMHVFATNLCVWVRTLIRETLMSFKVHASHSTTKRDVSQQSHYTNTTTAYDTNHSSETCYDSGHLLHQASFYLFPCILEYSMLAAATMYSMYADIGFHSKKKTDQTENDDGGDGYDAENADNNRQHHHHHHHHHHTSEISFHKTHRGLFLGVLFLSGAIASMVIYFSYLITDQETVSNMNLIYYISDLSMHSVLLVVVIVAWILIQRLKLSTVREVSIDSVLLIMGMTGYFLFDLFTILSNANTIQSGHFAVTEVLSLANSLVSAFLVIIQTCFMMDGMCRHSVTPQHLRDKPARGAVTFLLLGNIALWMFKTFQLRQVSSEDQAKNFYGALPWTLITHVCLPLLMFYHFHSSACLAHIWSGAYHKEKMDDDHRERQKHESIDTVSRKRVTTTRLKLRNMRAKSVGTDTGTVQDYQF